MRKSVFGSARAGDAANATEFITKVPQSSTSSFQSAQPAAGKRAPEDLRVLVLEDNEADAELMLRELRRAGYAPRAERLESRGEFESGLGRNPDLILCDYSLPGWTGIEALKLFAERGLALPFIVVSGTIGDERAAELIKLGADDYLLKDRLARLGGAVRAALEKHRLRREAKRADEALLRSNRMLAMLSATGSAIMRTRNSGDLLSEVCRIAVQIGGFRLAWICLLDPASREIQPLASAGDERGIVGLICRNSSSAAVWAGAAWNELSRGQSVVIEDIASSKHYPLRGEVLARGIRSAGFVPCGLQGERHRVIALYAAETGFFEPEQLRLFETLAADVTFALESYASSERLETSLAELRENEARFRSLTELGSDFYWETDPEHRFTRFEGRGQAVAVLRQKLIGIKIWEQDERYRPEPLSFTWDTFRAQLRAREPFRDLEFIANRPDGTHPYLSNNGEPVLDRDGNFKGYRGVTRDISARKRAEIALSESESKFRQMAENIRDVFFLADASTNRTLYVSPAYEQIWGRSCESAYTDPESWMASIHPDDRARTYENYTRGQASGSFEFKYRIVRPDGRVRDIRVRGYPVHDEAGKLIRVAGVAVDVTERLQLEAALQEREAGLQHAQVMAKLAHVVTGPDGSFESWSETLPHLVGANPEQMPKSTRDWLQVVHPQDRSKFRSTCIHAAKNSARESVSYRLLRKDGSVVRIRQVMEPIDGWTDAQGRTRWFNTLQDVTEERHNRAALADSESRFRQIAENISDAFLLFDSTTGQVFYASPAYEKIWGLSRESLYDEPNSWLATIHPEDRAGTYEYFRKVLLASETSETEFRIVRPDETMRWVNMRGFSVRGESGNIVRVAGIASDITKRKEAEVRIAHLSRVYAMLSGINALIVRVREREELFREACRIAVEEGGFRMAWIGIVDRRSMRIVPVAWAGANEKFMAELKDGVSLDENAPHKNTARAVREKKSSCPAIRTTTPAFC